ncbi:MAG: glutamate synthase subunit alpha, partial [Acidobacteria bacterium]|nr:glutamate synthase subunit alpha [Acidobacteriota bacterium]
MTQTGVPLRQGLYDPRFEHDACGVGFLVDLKGRSSHTMVEQGIRVLMSLAHRGACGCEKHTGDGAGVLLQMPHRFLAEVCEPLKMALPAPGEYGVGMVFLPADSADRLGCERLLEQIVGDEAQQVLGWRTVPTDNSPIGPTAKAAEPVIRQIFVGRDAAIESESDFERKLYVIRKRVEAAIKASDIRRRAAFYIPSLSCRTVVYKGMLMGDQVATYYPDLTHPALETALIMVHSRFSTNTFPSWARAHPYRYLCHNGEINT